MRNSYYDIPRLSASTLKLGIDPNYGIQRMVARLNKDDEQKDTKALYFGRLVHLMLFEPIKFDQEFALSPFDSFRTKEAQSWKKAREEAGVTIITEKEFQHAERMVTSLKESNYASDTNKARITRILDDASLEAEKVILWEEEGLECKAKFDAYVPSLNVIIDYKTTQSLSDHKLLNSFFSLGYHVQLAHYSAGVKKAYGLEKNPAFLFITQEKDAPYLYDLFSVESEFIERGESVRQDIFKRYKDYLISGFTEQEEMRKISLPAWA